MWAQIATAVISGLALVLVAVINRRTAKTEARSKAHQEQRERESRLSMDMMSASIELGDVTAYALAGGELNGNVEQARQKAKTAQEAYYAFLKDETARAVSK